MRLLERGGRLFEDRFVLFVSDSAAISPFGFLQLVFYRKPKIIQIESLFFGHIQLFCDVAVSKERSQTQGTILGG